MITALAVVFAGSLVMAVLIMFGLLLWDYYL